MPERKAVLLFGDSIRVGYAETVKEALSDIADVFYPLGNGRNTQYLMTGLYTWSSLCNPEAVDLIHFNCGHWDAAHWNRDPLPLTPIPAYAENLRRIVWAMRKLFPHAKITFAASTPMCPGKEDPLNPPHE